MLIEKDTSLKGRMRGKVVLLTGAGGGIGVEAAKAFAYMGAKTIIAEIDPLKGMQAESQINELFGENLAEFYRIDLSDAVQINAMTDYIQEKYGCPDIVFNNATAVKMGAVEDVPLDFWDRSYAVNLKAPVLLAQKFLPAMKKQNSGTLVFVSSSGASPYMGAYEVFKTAQVELSNTLAMELEGTNVYTYTIGPGLVKTQTAMEAIRIVASGMNMTTDDFYKMNDSHILDAESAGVGFALSTQHASSYNGQEIGSIQVLMDFQLIDHPEQKTEQMEYTERDLRKISTYSNKILATFTEQYDGWKAMNIFEKQWVLRDFKKFMAYSAEQAYEKLKHLNSEIQHGNDQMISTENAFLEKLKEYWKHQLKLLQGYEKNKLKLEENTHIIKGWIMDIEKLQGR